MADVLEVPKSKVVALFKALGFKLADKWDCDKLTKKINSLDEVPDEPFETEGLDELVDQLQDAESVLVVEDDEELSDETTEVEDDVEAEDDDIEDEKPAKKSEKDKKSKKSKEAKTEKKEKSKKDVKEKPAKKETAKKDEKTVDDYTLELITSKPMTMETIIEKVIKMFPDKDADVIKKTTYRRLHGHLQKKFGVTINKSEKGAYSVK